MEAYSLKHSGLANCCGISTIYDFANTRKSGGRTGPVSVKTLEAALKEKLREYSVRNKAMLLITLNQEQHDMLRHMMKRCGFRCVSVGWHPAHANNIFLYTLVYKRNDVRPPVDRTVTRWVF